MTGLTPNSYFDLQRQLWQLRDRIFNLEKDWSVINKANRKVLDYVFKKQKPG